MNKKARKIIAGVVAFAGATSPITTLAYTDANLSTASSNTKSSIARGGVTTGYYETTSAINFRKTASWSGTIISTINKGVTVYVVSESNGWAKIQHNNTTGYVPSEYLKNTSTKEIVTTSVNLRKTASWSGDIIQVIKAGEEVLTQGKSGEFSKVLYNGKSGYIPTQYIKSSTNTANSDSSSGSSTTNIEAMNKTGKVINLTTGDTLNVRSGTNSSTSILGTLSNGATVNITGKDKTTGWYRINFNGKTGFVSDKYIQIVADSNTNIEAMNKTGKVVKLAAGDTLNVRSGTNSNTSLLGTLSNGTTVKITGRDKTTGWYQINFNGKTGYVSDYYIEIVTETSSTTTYKKTTDNLNMRSGPSTSYSVITKIPAGTSVKVISSSNGWDYVEYDGQKGYCSNSYLVATNEVPTVKKITTDNLNFRTGPSTSNSIISTIPKNTVVDVISTSNGWSKIKYNGKEGYVAASYLANYTGESSSSGGGSLPSSKPSYSKRTVVIDPGHGGHDPGAVAFGRNEKDIALSISKKINANLKTLGFKTIMTRSTDVYVTLSERYSIANRNNADLFVSVHLNSSTSSAEGIETLYRNSKTFASDIQTEMINATGARNRGIKQRTDLAVLNGSKMPATLVETGFISNGNESSKLATTSYQDKLATSITKGIAKYTDSNL